MFPVFLYCLHFCTNNGTFIIFLNYKISVRTKFHIHIFILRKQSIWCFSHFWPKWHNFWPKMSHDAVGEYQKSPQKLPCKHVYCYILALVHKSCPTYSLVNKLVENIVYFWWFKIWKVFWTKQTFQVVTCFTKSDIVIYIKIYDNKIWLKFNILVVKILDSTI